jgi:hypothetical protein
MHSHDMKREDLKQILETPSAQAYRKHTASWNTIIGSLPSQRSSSSLWNRAIAIPGLSLYSDMPPPCPRLLLSQTFTCINTLAILSHLFLLFTWPMKMEQSAPKH